MIPIIAQQHLLKLLRMQVGGNFAPKHCEANQTSIPNLICQIYFSKVAHHATVLSKNEISLPFRRRKKRLVRRISIQKSFRKSFFLLLSSMIDDVASVKSLNVFNNLLQKPIFFSTGLKKSWKTSFLSLDKSSIWTFFSFLDLDWTFPSTELIRN